MTQQPQALTPDQVKRYSRHIIMGDVGSRGQRKLFQSKALIVGAGGLGSPSAVYLALAGVGTIGIVDFDVVELSNLQRQILHHTADVGRSKLESARDNIKAWGCCVILSIPPGITLACSDLKVCKLKSLRLLRGIPSLGGGQASVISKACAQARE